VTIPIVEEHVQSSKFLISKNSEEEAAFVKEATLIIKSLDTSNLTVVATTRYSRTNDLTTSKALQWAIK